MNSDRFKRVESIFSEAARLNGPDRDAFIEQACGADAELRREVAALLTHDTQPIDMFRTPVLDAGKTLREKVRRVAAEIGEIPQRIGSYRLIRVIGEGGFGVVYLAEQDMPRRTVAIKILRPGLTTRGILKRFEYEAEVLGKLHHPGIAQIYEAGAADVGGGRRQAFVAMEYVDGKPLTQFANEKKIGIRERLELIARVCDAVQHAHQKGIIHRDLKPANILIIDEGPLASSPPQGSGDTHARYTALRGQPKILDFGVARASDAEHGGTTLQTGIGQLIGTLPYMSPEQVSAEPGEVDTRSDVYAIGVLMFELLTGRLPYDLGSRSIPDAARVIREESPAKLSAINRVFRGEIDTIVQEALEKDKRRRYQSAAALGEDIRRYLRGDPIAAKRDSTLYVLKKQIRRYWAASLVAATFMLLLVGFSIYVSLQSRTFRLLAERESSARREVTAALGQAQQQRARADQNAALLSEQLIAANIEQGRLLGQTGATQAAEKLIWPEYLQNPDSTHAYWALWDLYSRDPWMGAVQAHEQSVVAIRFLKTRPFVISAGIDGKIRVWRTPDLVCIATIPAHNGSIHCLEISPDDRWLISSGADRRICQWDLATFDLAREFVGRGADLVGISFHPSGKYFLDIGTNARGIPIRNSESGDIVEILPTPTSGQSALFLPDGKGVAASLRTSIVRVWPDALGNPTLFEDIRTPNNAVMGLLSVSTDGRRLICGGYSSGGDRELRVFDLEQCTALGNPPSPNDKVGQVFYSKPLGAFLTSGWWSVNIWNDDVSAIAQSLQTPEGIIAFDLSPDGRLLAFGSSNGSIRLRELNAERSSFAFDGAANRTSASLSPDGRLLVTGDVDGVIRVWSVDERRLLAEWKGHANRVQSLRFDPAGRRLATGSLDRTLKVWDLETGSCVETFPNHHERTTRSVAWSPDGRSLAYMGSDYYVHLVDTDTWTEQSRIFLEYSEPLGLAFGNVSPILATITRGKVVRVFSLDGRLLAAMESLPTMWTCEFNADDSLLAGGNWGWSIELFDWRNEVCIGTLNGHTSTVWAVDFHPRDPRIIASTASDGTVRLFDIYSQRCLLTLGDFANSEVLSVGFSADGTRLCASNSTGRAKVWDIAYYAQHIEAQRGFQMRQRAAAEGRALQANSESGAQAPELPGKSASSGRPDPSAGVLLEKIAAWGNNQRWKVAAPSQ